MRKHDKICQFQDPKIYLQCKMICYISRETNLKIELISNPINFPFGRDEGNNLIWLLKLTIFLYQPIKVAILRIRHPVAVSSDQSKRGFQTCPVTSLNFFSEGFLLMTSHGRSLLCK